MSALRDVDVSTAPHCLRAVIVECPTAHPAWHSYYIALVHLRSVEGLPDATRSHANSSHEVSIFAMNPRVPIPEGDPVAPQPQWLLMPQNLVHQLRGHTDATALAVFGDFVEAIAARRLSPDTDQMRQQLAWLDRRSAAS